MALQSMQLFLLCGEKNSSKSGTIWNQTVSAIIQAKNDIFQKFQIDPCFNEIVPRVAC